MLKAYTVPAEMMNLLSRAALNLDSQNPQCAAEFLVTKAIKVSANRREVELDEAPKIEAAGSDASMERNSYRDNWQPRWLRDHESAE